MGEKSLKLTFIFLAAVTTCSLAADQNTTLFEEFSLNLVRKDSSPNYLLIGWTLPETIEFDSDFKIKAQKKGSDNWIIGFGEMTATEYKLADLMTNSQYNICMFVDLISTGNGSDYESTNHSECVKLSTPPAIRADSVLVLLAVIGYLLAMILLGYICWSCAHRGQQPETQDDEESEAFEEKIENGDTRPFLLNAQPPGSLRTRPRSAIEDEDIPFITPTWDQLAREK